MDIPRRDLVAYVTARSLSLWGFELLTRFRTKQVARSLERTILIHFIVTQTTSLCIFLWPEVFWCKAPSWHGRCSAI